jgi:hypothetical protein
MYKVVRPLLAIATFLLCANFGVQDESVTGREKPRINFYGTLTDTAGKKYKVESITISGMYKQVPVYQKPKNKETDPSINITRIDFAEVHSIHVPHPNVLLIYNNRQYVEITIASKDITKTKDTYIIERSKRVICDQINTAGPIEKDLSFQAVDKLVFEGHKPLKQEDKVDNKKEPIATDTKKKMPATAPNK